MVKTIDLSDDNLANLMLDQGVSFVPESFPETLSPAHAAWQYLLYSDRMRPNLVVWAENGRWWEQEFQESSLQTQVRNSLLAIADHLAKLEDLGNDKLGWQTSPEKGQLIE